MGIFGSAWIGLAAGFIWGAGDFSGGLATKSSKVLSVTVVSNAIGVLLSIAYAVFTGAPAANRGDILLSVAAGTFGLAGILAFYRALAQERMGLAAPVSALVANIISVAYSSVFEGRPNPWQWVGFFLASLGVWFIGQSTQQTSGTTRTWSKGIWLAIFSGFGFAGFFIFFGQLSSSSTAWPLVALRCTSFALVVLLLLLTKEKIELRPASRLPAFFAGLFDTLGNALFAVAAQLARLDVAAILSSLYPASTVLLARIILNERLTRQQWFGVSLCLLALPLIVM